MAQRKKIEDPDSGNVHMRLHRADENEARFGRAEGRKITEPIGVGHAEQ